MKTIGILGGMSATSTQLYCRHLCDMTRQTLGGLHSPELLIRSLDFAEIERYQMSDDWHSAGKKLNDEAKMLEKGGAQLLLVASNTMHKLADVIMQDVDIPLIHIADATARQITNSGLARPGLMATAFTMEQDFYVDRLKQTGLAPIIPVEGDRKEIHHIIYEELCKDIINKKSRLAYELIAQRLIDGGADCMILGCTEVGMLLNANNVDVPVFDTTLIHCQAALEAAMRTG